MILILIRLIAKGYAQIVSDVSVDVSDVAEVFFNEALLILQTWLNECFTDVSGDQYHTCLKNGSRIFYGIQGSTIFLMVLIRRF